MFNKFKEIIGLEDEDDFIEEMEEKREEEEVVNSSERETIFNTKKSNSYGENKLVNIHVVVRAGRPYELSLLSNSL